MPWDVKFLLLVTVEVVAALLHLLVRLLVALAAALVVVRVAVHLVVLLRLLAALAAAQAVEVGQMSLTKLRQSLLDLHVLLTVGKTEVVLQRVTSKGWLLLMQEVSVV